MKNCTGDLIHIRRSECSEAAQGRGNHRDDEMFGELGVVTGIRASGRKSLLGKCQRGGIKDNRGWGNAHVRGKKHSGSIEAQEGEGKYLRLKD